MRFPDVYLKKVSVIIMSGLPESRDFCIRNKS